MKLITFATINEAAASLSSFDAKLLQTGLYSSTIGLIAITGIGSYAASAALKRIPYDFDSIINIGLAGSVRPELELGSMHAITTCKKHLWHPQGQTAALNSLAALLEDIHLDANGLTLSTLDFPLHDVPDTLKNSTDLVDMEGYAIALEASLLGKKCQLYKLVSDHCTGQTVSQIKNNMGKYSQLIARFLNNN